jgi:hypothetical protein
VSRLSVAELVDLGDLDELLRRVDELCDAGDWAGVADLRDRCRAAFERGRQLWPASSHAEYRLALQAPARWAAGVLVPGAGRFALGPLTEVVASTHTWSELAPHLAAGPEAGLVAQERVVRGETVVSAPGGELPGSLQPWEPAYPLARYKPYAAEFADVPPPPMEVVEVPVAAPAARRLDDPLVADALAELVTPWVTQSNGRVAVAGVEGDGLAAVAAAQAGAARVRVRVRVARVDPAHAVALIAWAAASGGAHGRRRGMAYGRFAAWWAVAALAGLDPDRWPHPPGTVGEAAADLRWYRWSPAEPDTGWSLRLAAESPAAAARRRVAWAVAATDHS